MSNCKCKSFQINGEWVDVTYECILKIDKYRVNNATAIRVFYWDEEYGEWMPFSIATVNLPGKKTMNGCSFFDVNNAGNVYRALQELDIIVYTGYAGFNGYGMYPEAMINWPELQKYCEDDLSEYIKEFNPKQYAEYKEIMSGNEED